jgi:hypothetical protein
MFRATFAQMAKDRGVQIEAVSRALRRSNTQTPEQYYARIRADDAFAGLERAFLVQDTNPERLELNPIERIGKDAPDGE